jgi:hypothetical protein
MVFSYVDDQIWAGKDLSKIDAKIKALQDDGYLLTVEPDCDMFGFLGIERTDDQIELTQKGLIQKVLKTTGMTKADHKILLQP